MGYSIGRKICEIRTEKKVSQEEIACISLAFRGKDFPELKTVNRKFPMLCWKKQRNILQFR